MVSQHGRCMVAVRAVHAIDMSARDRKVFEILRRVPRRFAGSWEGGVWGAGHRRGGLWLRKVGGG